jgi:hypothetical protein
VIGVRLYYFRSARPARDFAAPRAPGAGWVETEHHLIVAHVVTKVGHDRTQLVPMSRQARAAVGRDKLTVLADRDYFSGKQILACKSEGVIPYIPKTAGMARLNPSSPISVTGADFRHFLKADVANAEGRWWMGHIRSS